MTAICCAISRPPRSRCWDRFRAVNAAVVAQALGIPTEIASFNAGIAMEIAVRHGRADLVVANNVLPDVPDLFDFAAGLSRILRPNGMVSLQLPHLLSLVQNLQFDAFRHDRLLLSVAAGAGTRAALGRPARVRCGASAGSWRLVARLRLPWRGSASRRDPRPEGTSSGRKTCAGLDRRDIYSVCSDASRAARTKMSRFPAKQARRRAPRCGLRRGGTGQHAAE